MTITSSAKSTMTLGDDVESECRPMSNNLVIMPSRWSPKMPPDVGAYRTWSIQAEDLVVM
jgi:hypothetical protein